MGELLHGPHVYRGLANGPSPRRGSKEGPWKGCIILDQWDRFAPGRLQEQTGLNNKAAVDIRALNPHRHDPGGEMQKLETIYLRIGTKHFNPFLKVSPHRQPVGVAPTPAGLGTFSALKVPSLYSKRSLMAPDGVNNLWSSHCENGCHVRRNSPLRLKQLCQIRLEHAAALSRQAGLRLVLVHWSECLCSGNRPRAGYLRSTHPCNCNM